MAKLITGNIVLNTDGDNQWGENQADTIDNSVPTSVKENSLCVDGTSFEGNDIYTSYDSKNDFMIFTGDSKIGSVSPLSPLALSNCSNITSAGRIDINSESCAFEYETAYGYFDDIVKKTGNRILIRNFTDYFSTGDSWNIKMILETPGVYFAGHASIIGINNNEDECASIGNNNYLTTNIYDKDGNELNTFPLPCGMSSDGRVQIISSSYMPITDSSTIWVDTPMFFLDPLIVQDETDVVLRIEVQKNPCGTLLNQTVTLGTLATTPALPVWKEPSQHPLPVIQD